MVYLILVSALAVGGPDGANGGKKDASLFSGGVPDYLKPAAGDEEDLREPFSIEPVAGYMRARDADGGTWFGGIQARFRMGDYLGLEGSITFHQDRFSDGDLKVTQYPVQVSALIYPLGAEEGFPLQPYLLGGVGWYYTRFDYSGQFQSFDDETDSIFGVHAGGGSELHLSDRVSLFADFRWIFMDEPGVDNSQIENEEFDSWQATAGLGISF